MLIAPLLLITALLGAGGCNPPASELTPVVVQLAWKHQAQFAGLYAAAENGYYRDEGLEISFLPGGVDVDRIKPVLDGTAQFGIAGADELLIARSVGQPLVAVATVYRKSPIVFVTLDKTKITQPADFIGKQIRVTANIAPSLHAMMANINIKADQYSTIILPSDVQLFASGEPPIWGAYKDGLAFNLEQAGFQMNYIYPDDYGVHFYADTIFTHDDLIEIRPGVGFAIHASYIKRVGMGS